MWRGIINNKTVSSLLFSCSLVSTSLQPHRLYSPPGSSVHEISQARILEWLAISFSRASSPPRDLIRVCCIAGRFFFLFFFNSYFFLALLGLLCCTGFCLVVASRGYASLWCWGFSLWWLLSFRSTNSRAVSSTAVAPGLWSTGSAFVADGLSRSTVCEIVPAQGLDPHLLCWQVDS